MELAPANLHCKVPMGGMLHELHASLCDTVTIVQNHMYSPWDLSKARDLAKDVDPYKDLKGVSPSQCLVVILWPIAKGTPVLRQESMKLYQAAMVEYGKAPCELLLIYLGYPARKHGLVLDP